MRRFLIRLGLAMIPIVACGFEGAGGPAAPPAGSSGSSATPGGSAGAGPTVPTAGAAGAQMQPSTGGGSGSGGSGSGNAGSGNAAGSSAGGIAQGGASGGASSAGAGAAGLAGSAGAGVGGSAAGDPHFKLLWRDDFDSFNAERWSKATHTFAENLARFTADNAVVEGGMLKLRVTNVAQGSKPYSAAEVYTKELFTYGRFEGRIQFCKGSGLVSSLFTYKDDVNTSWQEIDVEYLGYLSKSVQYNLVWGSLNDRKYQPAVVNFDYSPATEFHDYAIEWKPDAITFYVDGKQTHQDVQATIKDPARLRMNAWPTDYSVTTFAGRLDTTAIPCEAQYDWIQVSSYTP